MDRDRWLHPRAAAEHHPADVPHRRRHPRLQLRSAVPQVSPQPYVCVTITDWSCGVAQNPALNSTRFREVTSLCYAEPISAWTDGDAESRVGDASGAQSPPLTHLKANVGYAWSTLRSVRPQLAGVAGPMAGVALLLAVRLMGLQARDSRCPSGPQARRRSGSGSGSGLEVDLVVVACKSDGNIVHSLLHLQSMDQAPSGPG